MPLQGSRALTQWRVQGAPLRASFPKRRGSGSRAASALSLALIHRSAWNRNSANFALTEFCEVGADKQLLSNEKNTLLEGGAIFGEAGRLRWV